MAIRGRTRQKCLAACGTAWPVEKRFHDGKVLKAHEMQLIDPRSGSTEALDGLTAAKLPRQVVCFDAGTSGIDAALAFQDASEVILVDACHSGHPPGTIFELNQQEIASQAEARSPNFHTLRWDQAIAVADQFCQSMPERMTVFLIEGQKFSLGDPVTPAVASAVEELAAGLLARLQALVHPAQEAGHPAGQQSAHQKTSGQNRRHDQGAS
ncbi:MAG: hydrogenase maturation protease [Planctomycetia bacterium]|nr:hydrogenase maturation protease [Planctomycetia bacterium]